MGESIFKRGVRVENELKNDGTAQWGKKLDPSFQEERILFLWYNLEKGGQL